VSNQKTQQPFENPQLIICEGADDCAFFHRLVDEWSLPRFHISSTASDKFEKGGNTKFKDKLISIKINRNYRLVENVIIVSDNDENPQASFEAICQQIREAGFEAPNDVLRKARGKPSITVMMIPLGKIAGNLECACKDAARNREGRVATKTDSCVALLGADDWR
jgi:hypothetical protein